MADVGLTGIKAIKTRQKAGCVYKVWKGAVLDAWIIKGRFLFAFACFFTY